jgi:uncharacterized UBP type Zn finger protein
MVECEHLKEVRQVQPRTEGCEDCLKTGDSWVELRLCLECGHVGCCDSSANRHARKHFHETDHPIMQAFGSEEAFAWCYPHKDYVDREALDQVIERAPRIRG